MNTSRLRREAKFLSRSAFVLAVLVMAISGCHQQAIRQHPAFKAHPSQVRNIAVLEPRVEIVERTLFRREKPIDIKGENIKKLGGVLANSLTTLLQMNGFAAHRISDADMAEPTLQNLLASHELISRRVFETQTVGLVDLRDFAVEVPTDTGAPSQVASADGFLYTNYHRWCISTSTVILRQLLLSAIAAGGGSSSVPPATGNECGSDIQVVLFRRDTMEVLWANQVSMPTLVTELVAEGVLERFPRLKFSGR